MVKTWFQHDMNAHKKAGLSSLLALKDGDRYYGKFWLLQENFYLVQLNKDFKNTIIINESELVKILMTNRRGLRQVLVRFRECLGIVALRLQKPFGTVYELTIPNALIYLRKRNLKNDNKSLDIDKELEGLQPEASHVPKEKEMNPLSEAERKEGDAIALKFAKELRSPVKDISAA